MYAFIIWSVFGFAQNFIIYCESSWVVIFHSPTFMVTKSQGVRGAALAPKSKNVCVEIRRTRNHISKLHIQFLHFLLEALWPAEARFLLLPIFVSSFFETFFLFLSSDDRHHRFDGKNRNKLRHFYRSSDIFNQMIITRQSTVDTRRPLYAVWTGIGEHVYEKVECHQNNGRSLPMMI